MTAITLTTLPERVDLTDRLIVEHDNRIVGNIQPGAAGGVVAYCELNDTLGGGETTREALDWLRKMVATNLKTVIAEPVAITKPGLYDLAPDVYHGDPVPEGSMSVTRSKVLLTEGGAAKFAYRAQFGAENKPEFDFGNLAHALALGKGAERLTVVDADSWRTKAAQAARDKAYAEGKSPVLKKDIHVAEDMAEQLDKHTEASEALSGRHEVAMFWKRTDGLWLRGQLDAYVEGSHIGDYKTAVDASGPGFIRAAWNYRYYMQAAWYQHLLLELTGDKLPFRFVAQEKTAPYLVSVWEPSRDYLELGIRDMDEAIQTFQSCSQLGQWPGYSTEVQLLTPPDWAMGDDIEIGA